MFCCCYYRVMFAYSHTQKLFFLSLITVQILSVWRCSTLFYFICKIFLYFVIHAHRFFIFTGWEKYCFRCLNSFFKLQNFLVICWLVEIKNWNEKKKENYYEKLYNLHSRLSHLKFISRVRNELKSFKKSTSWLILDLNFIFFGKLLIFMLKMWHFSITAFKTRRLVKVLYKLTKFRASQLMILVQLRKIFKLTWFKIK